MASPTAPLASIKGVSFLLDWQWPESRDLTMGLGLTILSFFYLPRIETLRIHIPAAFPTFWPDWSALPPPAPTRPNPPALTHLKELTLETFRFLQGNRHADMILEVSSALEVLRWSVLFLQEETVGFSLTDLSSTLRAAAGRPLKQLTLEATRASARIFGPPQVLNLPHPQDFITGELSLAPLANVTWLALPWPYLFGLAPGSDLPIGPSTFPPKLSHLCIHTSRLLTQEHHFWTLFERARAARDFLNNCRLYAPKLRVCDFGPGVFAKHPMEQQIRRGLEHAGEAQGVEVRFGKCCFLMPSFITPPRAQDEVPED